jgi:N-acetylglucosaminyldiphosphoundecaprenol N-acetyl-beta-D-mannosaminyltransferase
MTSWKDRWAVLVGKIRVARSHAEAGDILTGLSHPRTPLVLGFVNAHAMNLCASDADFFAALSGADVLLRDGSGMSLLYRRLSLEPGVNMNGTDLIPKILERFRNREVALWGTQEPFVTRASQHAAQHFGVRVVSARHGFDSEDSYLSIARSLRPELIVLGMGMPRQERLARRLRSEIEHGALIVCGGAILDFIGGNTRRAPELLRRIGLEWLYRLAREPKRLFRRYVVGNPLFVARLVTWRKRAGR